MNQSNRFPPGYIPLTHHEFQGAPGKDERRSDASSRSRAARTENGERSDFNNGDDFAKDKGRRSGGGRSRSSGAGRNRRSSGRRDEW